MRLEVPPETDFGRVARFLAELAAFDEASEVTLDFAGVGFTPPAWLVVMGGALRRLRREHPELKCRAVNFRHMTYAAHVGFFDHFGLRFGLKQGEAKGSDTYVPLIERETDDVRRAAALELIEVGDAIHADAERLATILTHQTEGDLQDALAYSVREIIRNVVEHSEADSYTFAAQYWPARGMVELVVSDQGIGLAESLGENPRLTITDDADALTRAIEPGTSSKAWKSNKRDNAWANSGYGLFVTERLCRSGEGSFELMSGERLLRTSTRRREMIETDWPGTVVVLRLDTRDLGRLDDRLAELNAEGRQIETARKGYADGPSRASQTSKPTTWKGKT